ncbi:hypothetical protein SOM61_06080 [Massilia sp. CFBP9012]|uniref:hypothetical protein n=1 Tax=Massilia sp. CFBP9012 TaxID=3096531 RepID=UPI002A6A9B79|nr:hypothetical protein [Massilia sp. CFBP9012]MDY0974526.1 hypothetical protein [Massilia sp. CFBP9012]
MTASSGSLQEHYNTMWEHAFVAIARGDVDCDINDWYMSSQSLVRVAALPLRA